jgi:hypothetical protein
MSASSQTQDEIYNLIRQAIIDKNVVVATYRGHVREMCPHALGKKHGRQRAFLYQFAGGSSSGLEPDGSWGNWRCLFIGELSDVSIKTSSGEWHTAPNYSAATQNCMDEIDVAVLGGDHLAIHILPVPNREHENQQDSMLHLINHTIIANPNSPGVSDTLHLPASGRKWIVS